MHYGEVRGDVLRPPHGSNASCIEVKEKSKRLPMGTKNTLQIENEGLSFIETFHKQ